MSLEVAAAFDRLLAAARFDEAKAITVRTEDLLAVLQHVDLMREGLKDTISSMEASSYDEPRSSDLWAEDLKPLVF